MAIAANREEREGGAKVLLSLPQTHSGESTSSTVGIEGAMSHKYNLSSTLNEYRRKTLLINIKMLIKLYRTLHESAIPPAALVRGRKAWCKRSIAICLSGGLSKGN